MNRKNVVITGATHGIGKYAAIKLAKLGANVNLIARNEALAVEMVNTFNSVNPEGTHTYFLADLSSLSQVQSVADKINHDLENIHLLINNAGIINLKRKLTEDNYELTFAVNHLSHFLLTNTLLENLKRSAPSKVINTSSAAHYSGKIHFNDINAEKHYVAMDRYSMSKLANVLFTYKLARLLDPFEVTVNAFHPGFVASNFVANNGLFFKYAMRLIRPFQVSSKKSSQVLVSLATHPKYDKISSKYFSFTQQFPFGPAKLVEKRSNPLSYEEAIQERLWDLSTEMTVNMRN